MRRGGAVVDPNGALDIVVNTPAGWQLISVDPATTVIRKQVTLSGPAGSPAAAGGALWVVVATTPVKCTVQRLDPASLNVLSEVLSQSCPIGPSPNLAGAGDQLWTVGDGPKLQRIDVVTGAVSATITVPSTVSSGLHASTNSVFWADQTGVFRIDAAAGQLVKLGDRVDARGVLGTSRVRGGTGNYVVIGGGHAYWVYTAKAPQGTGLALYVENYPLR